MTCFHGNVKDQHFHHVDVFQCAKELEKTFKTFKDGLRFLLTGYIWRWLTKTIMFLWLKIVKMNLFFNLFFNFRVLQGSWWDWISVSPYSVVHLFWEHSQSPWIYNCTHVSERNIWLSCLKNRPLAHSLKQLGHGHGVWF